MQGVIRAVTAREILDSRGDPTLSVTVHAEGASGTFDVPAGASTGAHEAHELRDGEERFGGKGVRKATERVERIVSYALAGCDVADQKKVDDILLELDGTPNKSELGGNTLTGVSLAAARAAANAAGIPLAEHLRSLATIHISRSVPRLYLNLINGGLHAATRLAVQEYHVVPQVDSVWESLEMGAAIRKELKSTIRDECGPSAVGSGDEGGFVPDVPDVTLPLQWLGEAAKRAGCAESVRFSLDAAASSFYKDGAYEIGGKRLGVEELSALYGEMHREHGVFSIEDPFHEEDFDGFAALAQEYPDLQLVGDDLTVTNPARIKEAAEKKSVNAVIIKPNQIGTLSETLEAMRTAREAELHCIVSHRSGETCDDFIADLAVAFGAEGLKAGAPARGERVVKYNRLASLLSA